MTDTAEKSFFLVWCPEGTRPPKYRHHSFDAAAAEAERLANICMGQEFIVLEARRRVVAPRLFIEDYVPEDDDMRIPF